MLNLDALLSKLSRLLTRRSGSTRHATPASTSPLEHLRSTHIHSLMSLARRSGAGAGGSTSLVSSAGSGALINRPEWVGADGVQVLDRGNQSMIRVSASSQDHVNAYLEYERIVGDADGGKLFSEEEYAEFKANAIAHRANRIYVSWRNRNTGLDCRQVGPSSPCFCGHRFRQHATDNTNKHIHCRQAGCPCTLFHYIPIKGSQDLKCNCKHSYDVHNVTKSRKCKTGGCVCAGFTCSLSCSCRDLFGQHDTVFETREERQAAGRPVDNLAGGGQGYEAMGGITSFSSLVDGIDRLGLAPGEMLPQHMQIEAAAPPRTAKQKQEDEFALYDAKYKGKSGSSVRSSGSAASRGAGTGSAAAASSNYAQPALMSSSSAAASSHDDGGGGEAFRLFCTPHNLSSGSSSSSSAGALPSGAGASRARLTAGASAAAAGAPRRSAAAGGAPGSRLR